MAAWAIPAIVTGLVLGGLAYARKKPAGSGGQPGPGPGPGPEPTPQQGWASGSRRVVDSPSKSAALLATLESGQPLELTGRGGAGTDGSGPWTEIKNPVKGYMLAADVTFDIQPTPLPPPDPGCHASDELLERSLFVLALGAHAYTQLFVDPDEMHDLAAQLDAAGCPTQATAMRAGEMLVRMNPERRGPLNPF